MHNINYYNHDESAHDIDAEIQSWMDKCADEMGLKVEQINYVFCTDEELLAINKEYLNHDYYTDIITFDLSENKDEPVLTDLFISLDRIKENAEINNIPNSLELKRVMIHGILHICGYADKTPEEVAIIREKENYYIYL
jgi:probable rRNA maturation factor